MRITVQFSVKEAEAMKRVFGILSIPFNTNEKVVNSVSTIETITSPSGEVTSSVSTDEAVMVKILEAVLRLAPKVVTFKDASMAFIKSLEIFFKEDLQSIRKEIMDNKS